MKLSQWLKKQRDWATIWLGTLAICSVLSLMTNVFISGIAVSLKDDGAEYKRGTIDAQSKNYRWLKKDYSKIASDYLDYLKSETKNN